MGKGHEYFATYFTQTMQHEKAAIMLDWFRNLYEKNRWDKLSPSENPRIPKIIHQIWLGSPLPEKFKAFTQTWAAHHPDWQYKMWTDKDIAELNLENQDAYDKAINYAERSDIARYEILYRFGGLYVDTDCECLQSFGNLHYYYDFYAGLEFPCMALFLRPVIIPNALIASIPGHPIMRAMIDTIMTQKIKPELQHDIVAKTGPLLFSDIIMKHAGKNSNKDIIFPASFFYPIDKKIKDKAKIKKTIQPETFAIHHWAGSWILKEEAFVPGIKIRCKQEGNTLKFTISDERN
jgi:mannosyltransferase OCH1-like enzyme